MNINQMDGVEIDALEEQMLVELQKHNGFAGNVTLQRSLGWEESMYWTIRNRLYDRGLVTLGRGKGGSVTLIEREEPQFEESKFEATPVSAATESVLYEPIADSLRKHWIKDYQLRQSLVEVTAMQGRKQTGGKWTRPDIVVAGLRIFPYLPGKYFDIFSFEVKPNWAVNVTAVYEALAHRRAATHSFVWIHWLDDHDKETHHPLDLVIAEAKRFGVGVITGSDPRDYNSWTVHVPAVRTESDPEALNDFIAAQLSPKAKEEIQAWVR